MPGRPRNAPLVPRATTATNQMARTRRVVRRMPLNRDEAGDGRTEVDIRKLR